MRVLLLGSNGQLGTDLQQVAADREDVELIPWTRDELNVEDLEGIGAKLESVQFDVLVNCTSYHKTDEVEDNGTKAVAVNAHAVREMAEACHSSGARFVHISTDYVFPGTADRPYRETDCPAPINVYGISKYMGESLAQLTHDDTLIVRVASLFGVAGASGKGGNFVETMIRLANDRGVLRVINNIRMSPTSTEYVADNIFRLLEAWVAPGIYHVVNSGDASWFEFAREIMRMMNLSVALQPVTHDEFPSPAMRPFYSALSNARLIASGGTNEHWTEALGTYLSKKGYI